MHQDLITALDALYREFATYSAPRWVRACACCHEPEEGAPSPPAGFDRDQTVMLTAPGNGTPLRQLSTEDLFWYADEAPNLVGSEPDWKHYLPRILELTVSNDPLDWLDAEIVIGRLAGWPSTPWLEWPSHEIGAVRDLLHGYWIDTLSSLHDDGGDRVDSALCAISLVEPSIDWYLSEWATFTRTRAARNLVGFLQFNLVKLTKGLLANPFWDMDDALSGANELHVIEWLRSDALLESVVAATSTATDADEIAALGEVFDALGSLRR